MHSAHHAHKDKQVHMHTNTSIHAKEHGRTAHLSRRIGIAAAADIRLALLMDVKGLRFCSCLKLGMSAL